MIRLFPIVGIFIVLPTSVLAGETDKGAPRRRVFVLHSGLHTIMSHPHKNLAAEQLRQGLHERGVAEDDLIVLENPFPTASWRNAFPRDALTMYLDSMDPGSRVAHDNYLRLHKALKKGKIKSTDEIVWVGHSAGGQVGLGMAHLASKLEEYPDLAKDSSPYRFDMVILVGTPLGHNPLPSQVKLRAYYSPSDLTVEAATRYGPFALFALGLSAPLYRVPCKPGDQCMVRIFPGVPHHLWNTNASVLDCIVGEFQADYCPRWMIPPPLPSDGLSLTQLLARAVGEDCHVTLESLPRP